MFHHKKIQVYRNLDGITNSPHDGRIPVDIMDRETFRKAIESTAANGRFFEGIDLLKIAQEELRVWHMREQLPERRREMKLKLAEKTLGKPYPQESISEHLTVRIKGLLSKTLKSV